MIKLSDYIKLARIKKMASTPNVYYKGKYMESKPSEAPGFLGSIARDYVNINKHVDPVSSSIEIMLNPREAIKNSKKSRDDMYRGFKSVVGDILPIAANVGIMGLALAGGLNVLKKSGKAFEKGLLLDNRLTGKIYTPWTKAKMLKKKMIADAIKNKRLARTAKAKKIALGLTGVGGGALIYDDLK